MKIALITGCNRGIGHALLYTFGPEWTIVAAARQEFQIPSNTDAHIVPLTLDINDEESCAHAANVVMKQFGRLDLLINNAGVMARTPMQAFDLDEMRQVMETNLYGAMRLTKHLLPLMRNSAEARIVNVSSQMGQTESMISGGYAAYRMSKWALNGFSMLLAGELRSANIKVVAVCPGWCQTDMGGARAPYSVQHGADVVKWASTDPHVPTGKFIREKQMTHW